MENVALSNVRNLLSDGMTRVLKVLKLKHIAFIFVKYKKLRLPPRLKLVLI